MMTSRLCGRSLAAAVERMQPDSSSFLASNFRCMSSTVKVPTPSKKTSNHLVPPTKLVEKVAAAKTPLDRLQKNQSVQRFKCPKCDFTDESKNNIKQVKLPKLAST
jgi:hypothetical protein